MSEEVIPISSDESDKDVNESFKNRKRLRAYGKEKKAKKRNLSDGSFDDGQRQKSENGESSSQKPECSKSFSKEVDGKDDFENFKKTCLDKRDDKDMKKVLKKLEKSYKKLSSSHKNDDKFRSHIKKCQRKMSKTLSKDIFTIIKDLHLEIQKRLNEKSDDDFSDEESGLSKKDITKIVLLEKAIQRCVTKIKALEEQENDDSDEDNDENSAYIIVDRYKRKLIQLCNSLSKLKGDRGMRKQIFKKKVRRSDIVGEMTGISSVDESILNLINADIGKINKLKYLETQGYAGHVKVPEYFNVLECLQKYNKEVKIDEEKLSEEVMNKLAKRAFETVVTFLQKKRVADSRAYMEWLSNDQDNDPADKDKELERKLKKSEKEGKQRLAKVFKKYVELQKQNNEVSEEKLSDNQIESSSDDESKSDTNNEDSDKDLSLKEDGAKIHDQNDKLRAEDEHKMGTKSQCDMKIVSVVSIPKCDENIDKKCEDEIENNDEQRARLLKMTDEICRNVVKTLKNGSQEIEEDAVDSEIIFDDDDDEVVVLSDDD